MSLMYLFVTLLGLSVPGHTIDGFPNPVVLNVDRSTTERAASMAPSEVLLAAKECTSAGAGVTGWFGRMGDAYKKGLRYFQRGDWEEAIEELNAVGPSHECYAVAQEILPVAQLRRAIELWSDQGWRDDEDVAEAQQILASIDLTPTIEEAYERWHGPIQWGTGYDDLYYATGTTNIRVGPSTQSDAPQQLKRRDAVQLGPPNTEQWAPVHRIHPYNGESVILSIGSYDREALVQDTLGFVHVPVLTVDAPPPERTNPDAGRTELGPRLGNEINLTAACKVHVESLLSNPRSADFPMSHSIARVEGSNNRWVLRSHVDSENRAGATKRTHFVCEGTFHSRAGRPDVNAGLEVDRSIGLELDTSVGGRAKAA